MKIKTSLLTAIFTIIICMSAFAGGKGETTNAYDTCRYVTGGRTHLSFYNPHISANFVKFKVKKTRTYSFTIKNIKYDKKNKKSLGFFEIDSDMNGYGGFVHIGSTKGGTASSFRVCTKNHKSVKDRKNMTDSFLKSRTAKISLEKGTIVFINLYMAETGSGSFDLIIK